MTEKAENPEGIAGPPVGFVTVKNTGRLRGDPVLRAEGGKGLRLDVITDRVILEIALPIDVNGPGEMADADFG